jgi:DNA polymerase-3 subunit beta
MGKSLVFSVKQAVDNLLPVVMFASDKGKGVLPIYSHVLLKCTAKGLVAMSSNGAQFTCRTVSHDNTEECEVCIEGAKLRTILSSYKDQSETQSVTITFDDGASAVIKCGRSKLSLNVVDPTTYPSPDKVNLENVFEAIMPFQVWRDSLLGCSHAVAQNDARHYLNGMCIRFNDGLFTVISSDGHRLSRVLSNTVTVGCSIEVILPRRFLDMISIIPKGTSDIRIRIDSRMIEITWNGGQLRSQLVDGRYPNIDPFFSGDAINHFKVDRQQLLSALLRLRATVDDSRPAIVIAPEQSSELRVSTEGLGQVETGEDFITAEILNDFTPMALNINYLSESLNSFSDKTLYFSKSPQGVGHVLIKGEGEKTDIIVPINR